MMQVVEEIDTTRQVSRSWHNAGNSIALVPTLGNLHEGHLSLVKKAAAVADKTVVSIFVNPTQFVQGEDFSSYPRTLDEDLEQLQEKQVDLVFCPAMESMYSVSDYQARVTVTGIENIYCGASRPGHFAGVSTIVLKLFNIIEPDKALFGEKDYQQLLVIRQLVRDLFLPVEIIGMPTVREKDGLAMSSRNKYLDKSQRAIAPVFQQTLQEVAASIRSGDNNFPLLEKNAAEKLDGAGFCTDYLAICDADTLGPPGNADLAVLGAAWLGSARLIDNVIVKR